jgi:hypothetical protein
MSLLSHLNTHRGGVRFCPFKDMLAKCSLWYSAYHIRHHSLSPHTQIYCCKVVHSIDVTLHSLKFYFLRVHKTVTINKNCWNKIYTAWPPDLNTGKYVNECIFHSRPWFWGKSLPLLLSHPLPLLLTITLHFTVLSTDTKGIKILYCIVNLFCVSTFWQLRLH